ncbi:hypothetical protein DM01DRAFT_1339190 [Hesseltinella vesiculosa]|uniref:Uncharacterized protein n=1 Tax=Hesseltinella vesiculosa TaxID=101127 RepID=A0A1X2G7P7_9FUNG|nr:hypothetical protein DM01DRAFT_1339190 [Hesseltinella vesiculosa]
MRVPSVNESVASAPATPNSRRHSNPVVLTRKPSVTDRLRGALLHRSTSVSSTPSTSPPGPPTRSWTAMFRKKKTPKQSMPPPSPAPPPFRPSPKLTRANVPPPVALPPSTLSSPTDCSDTSGSSLSTTNTPDDYFTDRYPSLADDDSPSSPDSSIVMTPTLPCFLPPSNRSSRIRFSLHVEIYDTFAPKDYDRRSTGDVTCQRLTPHLAYLIKQELNEYKLNDMPVHPHSRQFTQFFM